MISKHQFHLIKAVMIALMQPVSVPGPDCVFLIDAVRSFDADRSRLERANWHCIIYPISQNTSNLLQSNNDRTAETCQRPWT